MLHNYANIFQTSYNCPLAAQNNKYLVLDLAIEKCLNHQLHKQIVSKLAFDYNYKDVMDQEMMGPQ